MTLGFIVVFLVSVLLISLIKFGLVSARWRLFVLFGVVALVAVLIPVLQLPTLQFYSVGRSSFESVIWYGLFAVMAIYVLYFAQDVFKTVSAKAWYRDPHFQYLFIPISFAQQLLFQGFILTILLSRFTPDTAIIVTAFIFGYLHTIYPRPL